MLSVSGSSSNIDEGTEITARLDDEIVVGSIGSDGTWSIDITTPEVPGNYQLVIETVGFYEEIPLIIQSRPKSSFSIDHEITTNEYEPSEQIEVLGIAQNFINKTVKATIEGKVTTGVINDDGNWSVMITAPENEGVYELTITIDDHDEVIPISVFKEQEEVEKDDWKDTLIIALAVFIVLLFAILLIFLYSTRKKRENMIEE
jgi:hypothetical protein